MVRPWDAQVRVGVAETDIAGLIQSGLVVVGKPTRFIGVRERDDRLAAAIGRYVHAAVAERLVRR
jgi:hypothetical protein